MLSTPEALQSALQQIVNRFYDGQLGPGPHKLQGTWTQRDFNAWSRTYDGPWRLSWRASEGEAGTVEVWGDPSVKHEDMKERVVRYLRGGMQEYLVSCPFSSGNATHDGLEPSDRCVFPGVFAVVVLY